MSKIASNFKNSSIEEKNNFSFCYKHFFSEEVQTSELWYKLNQNFMTDNSFPTVSVVRQKVMESGNAFLPDLDSPE